MLEPAYTKRRTQAPPPAAPAPSRVSTAACSTSAVPSTLASTTERTPAAPAPSEGSTRLIAARCTTACAPADAARTALALRMEARTSDSVGEPAYARTQASAPQRV